MTLDEYTDAEGHVPFREWFDALDVVAAARVSVALTRMEEGNLARSKSVGGGVLELKIDAGPGYRIYYGRDGDTLIILLGGGTKRRQERDIADAKTCWADYKKRKKG
ncbi:MAG: type II toxin-antitoxin system RelE/ParE family toxin [Hyphomonadaceae bacterium]|nr:type II toxin-antitoxin system RelE/ParE family toxin [Hyphomonadaceae bacterium]